VPTGVSRGKARSSGLRCDERSPFSAYGRVGGSHHVYRPVACLACLQIDVQCAAGALSRAYLTAADGAWRHASSG
jgi:hypothetical protein